MATEWDDNVRKYAPDADESVIAGIVRYCGIALRNRDSSLVSFGDPTETGRVRDNFLKKKLALTHSDADLDGAIAEVGERMKGENFKNRVTVYYLLAERFGALNMFTKAGGDVAAAAVGAGAAAAGAGAALGLTGGVTGEADRHVSDGTVTDAVDDAVSNTAHAAGEVASDVGHGVKAAGAAALGVAGAVGATALGAAGAAASGVANAADHVVEKVEDVLTPGSADREYAYAAAEHEKSGIGWLWWLLLGLLGAFLLWWLFMRQPAAPVVEPAATTAAVTPAGVDFNALPAEGSITVPEGAGVTSELRDNQPVVKVYFDTAKTEVVPAFAATATGLKSWLDAHPGKTLQVSGYNDPRGNAAQNAALSKGRAQAVKTELVKAGIADGAIELVKPAAATDKTVDNASARRVEVTVK